MLREEFAQDGFAIAATVAQVLNAASFVEPGNQGCFNAAKLLGKIHAGNAGKRAGR